MAAVRYESIDITIIMNADKNENVNDYDDNNLEKTQTIKQIYNLLTIQTITYLNMLIQNTCRIQSIQKPVRVGIGTPIYQCPKYYCLWCIIPVI